MSNKKEKDEKETKKGHISPYTRMDTKFKETILRLVGVMMQRRNLPLKEAEYVLDPLDEEPGVGNPGIIFFDQKGERIDT